jgi:hypothetical protein
MIDVGHSHLPSPADRGVTRTSARGGIALELVKLVQMHHVNVDGKVRRSLTGSVTICFPPGRAISKNLFQKAIAELFWQYG